jgi:hypothetical protein
VAMFSYGNTWTPEMAMPMTATRSPDGSA